MSIPAAALGAPGAQRPPRAPAAVAAPAPAPPASAPVRAPRPLEVRLALSIPAARTLGEPRLRRLIEIETEDVASLAQGLGGPLSDRVAYVWIDQPTASKILVEVRIGERPVARREIAIRSLAADVAAQLVAVATSEMLRAGLVPLPKPPPLPPAPAAPTADEIEQAARREPALVLTASGALAALPGASGFLGGPALEAGFRYGGLTETIYGRWLSGASSGSGVRWLETGFAVSYRFWFNRSFRLAAGASGGFSSVHLADAGAIDGVRGQRDSWSARAGGLVGLELRVANPLWVSLTLEPGAILQPVHYEHASGGPASLEGAWLGLGLGLTFEVVRTPAIALSAKQ